VVAQHAQRKVDYTGAHVQQYHGKWLRLTTQICLKSRLKLGAHNVAPATFLINLCSTNYRNKFSDEIRVPDYVNRRTHEVGLNITMLRRAQTRMREYARTRADQDSGIDFVATHAERSQIRWAQFPRTPRAGMVRAKVRPEISMKLTFTRVFRKSNNWIIESMVSRIRA
jgi:hypothetical protein